MAGGLQGGLSFDETGDGSGDAFGGYRPMADINVTPLVDVMLVLLIIFMVAAPLMVVGVPLDLPKTNAAKVEKTNEPVVVSIDKDGNFFIGEEAVSDADLIPRLQDLREAQKDSPIYVRGDKAIDYGQVMQLLGKIGQAGFAKVSLIAEANAATGAGAPTITPAGPQSGASQSGGSRDHGRRGHFGPQPAAPGAR
ncbi:MAG TPA: protein TolR [Alphaproteobacteria bacterium]|jgi:TolR protein